VYVFEAAGCGACLITDKWQGVDSFFTPGEEILVARSAGDIIAHLRGHDAVSAAAIGRAGRARALRDHSYTRRAADFEAAMETIRNERPASAPLRLLA
jgi:spore maturation protein CgeB